MSAIETTLLDFVRDMDRLDVPPFRYHSSTISSALATFACDMREAACADDAKAIAWYIRQTRLERLWRIETLADRDRLSPSSSSHRKVVA